MTGTLSGQSVLVNGASAGIGKATVAALVAAGASVLATGRRQAALDAPIATHGDAVQAIAGDVNDAGFVQTLVTRARDVDILVNNAGILTYGPPMDLTFADTAAMFSTNVLAPFRLMQATRAGNDRDGAATSSSCRRPPRARSIGSAPSTARPSTRSARSPAAFRLELQGFGIKVTEIASGMVDTDIRDASNHPAVQTALAARKFAPLTPQELAGGLRGADGTQLRARFGS